jgi:2-phospho-L-lactate/phosphoenolpyruvate guanylyltransferase
MADGWCLVIPVKRLAFAKTRLGSLAGECRESLALAFAADTVTAAATCPAVARVYVVTDDPRARSTLRRLGAVVVGDEPDAGINAALRYGARIAAKRNPGAGIGALSADLPALRPDHLARALASASAFPSAVVSDTTGAGTTLYTAASTATFAPAYGVGSLHRHLAGGARLLDDAGLETLRRDVDTPADLAAALQLGVGRHTFAALARLRGG